MSLHDFDHIDLEVIVFLVSSISSGSYILCASLSIQCAEAFDGDGFDGDTSFWIECSKVSNSRHIIWLWVSIFVPICYKRKILWRWLHMALIKNYSRMSLEVIFLLSSFCKTVVFGFNLGLRSNFSLVLGQSSIVRFDLVGWALSKISYAFLFPKSFVPPLFYLTVSIAL